MNNKGIIYGEIEVFGIRIDWIGLYKEWYNLYKRRPKKAIIIVLVLCILLFGIITGIGYFLHIDKKNKESRRLKNLEYKDQIQQLIQMEKNINELISFVDLQKKKLRDSEDAILRLKSEKAKLQPLIETDRTTVEAIFRLQEERVIANIWRERCIGFALGIIASLFASVIWSIISSAIITKRNRIKQEDKR